MVNFVWSDSLGVTIVTNKVVSNSDLQVIENYVKSANHIDSAGVDVPCLPQSKSYLKIIGIPYFQESLSFLIISSIVEEIIKQNYIFDNVVLALKPYVIKVSPKLDMAIV